MAAYSASRSASVDAGPIRVAFYGKAAREENASVSLERQLRAVSTALPTHVRISCHFADSGMWNSAREGSTTAGTSLDGYPVLGGLKELLRRAHDADHDFDVDVCFDDSRLPRRIAEGLAVEDELAKCGVGTGALDNVSTAHLLEPSSMLHGHWLKRLGDWGTNGLESLTRRSRQWAGKPCRFSTGGWR